MIPPIAQIFASCSSDAERSRRRRRMQMQGPAFTELVGRLLNVMDAPRQTDEDWDLYYDQREKLIEKLRAAHAVATREDHVDAYQKAR